ncbi:MAG: Uncharacterised protein [Acidimicrobiales bacterium AG-410-I20]|nr:MAG: Uncharacterised protein [Acidimicrobiales bacterium AG-410-I20]
MVTDIPHSKSTKSASAPLKPSPVSIEGPNNKRRSEKTSVVLSSVRITKFSALSSSGGVNPSTPVAGITSPFETERHEAGTRFDSPLDGVGSASPIRGGKVSQTGRNLSSAVVPTSSKARA